MLQPNQKANADSSLLGNLGSAEVNIKISAWTLVGIVIACMVIFASFFVLKKQIR